MSWPLLASFVGLSLLAGCRFGDNGRAPWRAEAEEQCLAEKGVVPSAFMEPLPPIDGADSCGMEHPFRVHAFDNGNVVLEPSGRLACPVIRETDIWVKDVVQPAALAWLGQPVVAIRQMSSYSCRNMNGQAGAKISEHAFGNALDIGAFRTADGRWITVKNGWKGKPEERGFLLQVQAGACERFTTVLAPGSNIFHYDHIHVDLMRHAKGRTYCKPAPRPMPAPNPPLMATMPPRAAPPAAPAIFQEEAPPPPLKSLPPPEPIYTPPTYSAPQAQRRYEPPQAQQRYEAPQARQRQDEPTSLPPGWTVGPEGHAGSGPMSYAPTETGSVTPRRQYYAAPVPQASPIPLPQAKPGED